MRLLEDLDVVENRGSGIASSMVAMRQANLSVDRDRDKATPQQAAASLAKAVHLD